MTALNSGPITPARPWTFTLMCLTAAGCAAILWLVASSAIARRDDARRHDAVRSELVRVDQLQSEWYAANGRFASALGAVPDSNIAGFVAAPGLVLRFVSLSGEGWNAVVSDTALATAPRSCGIFRGPPEASPHRAVTRPGVVACW